MAKKKVVKEESEELTHDMEETFESQEPSTSVYADIPQAAAVDDMSDVATTKLEGEMKANKKKYNKEAIDNQAREVIE